MVDGNQITFGVEIECCLPAQWARDHNASPGGYHSGRTAGREFPDGWLLERDSSIETGSDYMLQAEFISPVLRGVDGLAQVSRVIAKLQSAGAEVNSSCGFHVHIGLSTLTDDSYDIRKTTAIIRRLIALTSIHETALLSVSGDATRIGNTYCRSVKDAFKGVVTNRDIEYEDIRDYSSRYHVLNINSVWDNNTVELRCFGSTMNAYRAIGYIVLSVGLAHLASDVKRTPEFDDSVSQFTKAVAAVRKLHRRIGGYGISLKEYNEDMYSNAMGNQVAGAKVIQALALNGHQFYRVIRNVQQVDCSNHNVLLLAGGDVATSGLNDFRQANQYHIVHNVRSVAAGDHHTMILQDGHVQVWGGEPRWYLDHLPDEVQRSYVQQISAGANHCLVLNDNGNVYAWGDNRAGQCDTAHLGGYELQQISAGGYHNLALRGYTLHAWGDNTYGQARVPRELNNIGFRSISAGEYHNVISDSNNRAHAWGDNSHGECNLPGDVRVREVVAGYGNTVLIDINRKILCFGRDVVVDGVSMFEQLRNLTGVVSSVALGRNHAVVLMHDGTIRMFGDNSFGQTDPTKIG